MEHSGNILFWVYWKQLVPWAHQTIPECRLITYLGLSQSNSHIYHDTTAPYETTSNKWLLRSSLLTQTIWSKYTAAKGRIYLAPWWLSTLAVLHTNTVLYLRLCDQCSMFCRAQLPLLNLQCVPNHAGLRLPITMDCSNDQAKNETIDISYVPFPNMLLRSRLIYALSNFQETL